MPNGIKNINDHRKNRTPDAERKWRKRHGLQPLRRQGQRGEGKAVRADRQEACRIVAAALAENPTASATVLAEATWPGGGKAAVERARRALADLARKPWLVGDSDIENRVKEALAAREAAAEAASLARERKKAEREARRQERETRFRLQPARALLRRLLRYPEVAAKISLIVTARRRFAEEDERSQWWLFPRTADQMPTGAPIWHPAPGLAGQVVTSAGATWMANREIAVLHAAANMLSIPWQAARDILAAVRKLRRAKKKAITMAEVSQAQQNLYMTVRRALAVAALVDPAEWAGQYSTEIAGMNVAAREMAAAKEAGLWPLPGVISVTRQDTDDELESWQGKPLDAPLGDYQGLERVENDDVDPEIAEVFADGAVAVALAGGRRRGKGNGIKHTAADRAAAQEGLH